MKRYTLFILTLLTLPVLLMAQVSVRLNAPQQVEAGQRFQVRYVVNTQDIDDFRVGDFQGCEVLYGPSTSSQSSYSMVNGKTTSSASVTFTYTLLAHKEGKFTIPAASVRSGGKVYKSNTGSIEVYPSDNPAQRISKRTQAQQGGGQTQGQQTSSQPSSRTSKGTNITKDDLFITVSASKKKIFEQEAVVLTYKLYTLVNIRGLSGEMPKLDNCHVQELENQSQMSLKYERYNNRNYGTAIWRQYVIFPQKSGKITIPGINFDAEVEVINSSGDPFDIFFGGGQLAQMVRKTIVTPTVELDVKALPQPHPAGFSGAVGKFSLNASLSPQQVKANDAATLHLVVSGHGNMKLMKAPGIDFPKDFEVYDPKENDKTVMSSLGNKGEVTFDYLIVPRHGGKYSIPPVEFVYFDTETAAYKTLTTDSFHIDVAKGSGTRTVSVQQQEDLKELASDIRYIRTSPVVMRKHRINLFGTSAYMIYYGLMLVVFLLCLAVFHHQAKANADIARQRGRRAGKAATKRLKQAAKLLKEHKASLFYDETLRALIGYAADKLNLHTSDLNKENVREAMVRAGIQQDKIDRFIRVIEDCEFARYAPGDPEATMDKIFSDATDVINEME